MRRWSYCHGPVNVPAGLSRIDWNMFANIWYLSANWDCLLIQKGKKQQKKRATKVIEDIAKNLVGLQIGFPRFKLRRWGHFPCVRNNTISTCHIRFRYCVSRVLWRLIIFMAYSRVLSASRGFPGREVFPKAPRRAQYSPVNKLMTPLALLLGAFLKVQSWSTVFLNQSIKITKTVSSEW